MKVLDSFGGCMACFDFYTDYGLEPHDAPSIIYTYKYCYKVSDLYGHIVAAAEDCIDEAASCHEWLFADYERTDIYLCGDCLGDMRLCLIVRPPEYSASYIRSLSKKGSAIPWDDIAALAKEFEASGEECFLYLHVLLDSEERSLLESCVKVNIENLF